VGGGTPENQKKYCRSKDENQQQTDADSGMQTNNNNTLFAIPITNGIAHRKKRKKTEKEKTKKVRWRNRLIYNSYNY